MKKTKKKILSLLLTAVLVASLLPSVTLTAWAATTTYSINDGSVSISEAGDYVITGTGSATTNTITVSSGITGDVNITLNGVSIDVSGTTNACAFSIGTGSTVNLTLIGDSVLKSNGNSAGLQVPLGTGLTITAASTGSIAAAGGDYGAGIGAEFNNNAGYITINGGTVSATANYGAAIGGGYGSTGGNGGIITINGGVITATIINDGIGAAIGGGGGVDGRGGGDGGIISITGGTVTATAALGAAIGGGGCSTTRGGSGGNISISGGNITAKAEFADIGGGGGDDGWGGSGGTIIITGGTVKTKNPSSSAMSDIGGGCGSMGGGGLYAGDIGILLIDGGSVNSYVHGRSIFQSQANPIKEYKTTIKGLPLNSGVTCSINGGDAFSCDTDSSGYMYLWLPVGANEVLVNSGSASYKASGTITAVNTNELTASAYTADLSVTTASLPYGVIGTAYSQTLTAVGGTAPYTWAANGLPDGLSLDTATGIISGTPTAAGTYTVKANVTDKSSTPVSVSKNLILTVYATSSGSAPYITVANGVAFSVTLHNTDGKYAGINTVNSDGITGTITGTVSGSDTILTGTLTGVPTTWTEVALTGGKVMIRSVSPSTTVTDPSFH